MKKENIKLRDKITAFKSDYRGFVLVTVIMFMVLLVIIAVYFISVANTEQRAAGYSKSSIQAELAAKSACSDFQSRITGKTIYGSRREKIWRQIALPVSDLQARKFSGLIARAGKWNNIRDNNGKIIARYTFQLEDETGKLNLNVLASLTQPSKHTPLSMADISLNDNAQTSNLPVKLISDLVQKSIHSRIPYDLNSSQPGVNTLCPFFQQIFIDPVEWRFHISMGKMRELTKWMTVYKAGCPRGNLINLNTSDTRSIRRALKKANNRFVFEKSGVALDQIAANITDSRDENHVMSTLNNAYGVESIVINEILSHNDEHWLDARGYNPLGPGGGGVVRAGEVYENMSYDFPAHVSPEHIILIAEFDPQNKRVRFSRDTLDNAVFGSLSKQKEAKIRGLPNICMNELARKCGSLTHSNKANTPNWLKGLFAGRTLWFDRSAFFTNAFSCKVVDSQGGWMYLDKWPDEFPVSPSQAFRGNNPLKDTPGEWCASFGTIVTDNGCELSGKNESDIWYVFGLIPGQYYCVDLYNFAGPNAPAAVNVIDVDNSISHYSSCSSTDGKFTLLNGIPVVARPVNGCGGVVSIQLTGRPQKNKPSRISFFRLFGPEAIELYNCGGKAVSIRNWTLTIDRMGILHNLHTFLDVVHYSVDMQMQTHDPNPVIKKNGYLYLVNNARVFDLIYGNMRDSIWGDDSGEQMPVTRAKADKWGVPYTLADFKISDDVPNLPFKNITVECRGAQWNKGSMRGDIIQNKTERKYGNGQNVRKTAFVIADNTKNTAILKFRNSDIGIPWKRGDSVHIIGLPKGGVNSPLTLRNMYGQICARAKNIPSSAIDKPFSTFARLDPAIDEWDICRKASFGGFLRKCDNPSSTKISDNPVIIRNKWFSSPLDALNVRSVSPFRNVNSGGEKSAYVKRWTKAVLDTFSVPALQLSVKNAINNSGEWFKAFGCAAHEGTTTLIDENAKWEPGTWAGHTLNILSGKRKEQSYPVTKSTENCITVVGLSVPSRKPFRVKQGDEYCVGPANGIAYFYSCNDNSLHEWEWQDSRITPGIYKITVLSVNDSIDTSSILEKNWNARLEVSAWNFVSNKFDIINDQVRCGKNDFAEAGVITQQNISNGIVRVRIKATGQNAPKSSGKAWFGGLMLTPVEIQGKININAAAPSVLNLIPGIDHEMAEIIFNGDNLNDIRKPWQSLPELTDHINWSFETLAKSFNMIRITSGALRLTCIGEAVIDADNDGCVSVEKGDKISARKVLGYLLVSDNSIPQHWSVKQIPPIPQNLIDLQ